MRNNFCKLFFNNWLIRSSCFNCAFKTGKFESDLTCADLWGIESILPNEQAKNGMSLVLVHSPKGKDILRHVAGGNTIIEVSYSSAIEHNKMAIKSIAHRDRQDEFFADMRRFRFNRVAQKYAPGDSIILRIKKFLYPYKQMIQKLFKK